jgi:hypothetical protein
MHRERDREGEGEGLYQLVSLESEMTSLKAV